MTEIFTAVGWTVIHFVWQACAIALPIATLLRLTARRSANFRYLIACGGLAAMLVAPIATAWVLWPSGTDITPAAAADPRESRAFDSASRSSVRLAPQSKSAAVEHGSAGRWLPAIPSAEAFQSSTEPFVPAIAIAWLVGVSVLLTRMAGGWLRVRRLHRVALSMDASLWQSVARRLAFRLGLPAAAHVVESAVVQVPTLVGFLRPAILLPVAALASLSPAQVEAILAHELAHIRRHDYIVNVLQTLAETLLFYHPAVWWLSSRIRIEREHCCDDVAVAVCGDAVGYAEALATLEEWRSTSAAMAMAASGGSLLGRVRRILGSSANSNEDGSAGARGLATLTLTMVFVAGAGAVQHLPSWSDGAAVAGEQTIDAAPAGGVAAGIGAGVHEGIGHGIGIGIGNGIAQGIRGGIRDGIRDGIRGGIREGVRGVDGLSAAFGGDQWRVPPMPPEPPTPPEPPSPLDPIDAWTAVPPTPPVPPVPPVPPAPPAPPAPPMQPAQPVPPVPPAPPAPPQGGFSVSSNRDHVRMSWSNDGSRLDVNLYGAVSFNDDLTDVQSLSDGGSLTIRDWSGVVPRTIEIKSSGGSR